MLSGGVDAGKSTSIVCAGRESSKIDARDIIASGSPFVSFMAGRRRAISDFDTSRADPEGLWRMVCLLEE